MSQNPFQALTNDELARLGVTAPAPLAGPAQPVRLFPFVLNLFALFIVLILPALYAESLTTFLVMGAVMLASLMTANWPVLMRMAASLAGSNQPQITAVLKAPDRLFCPRCGAQKTSEYCSGCGAHVETEYRKITRQLVRFVVEDTERQRAALQAELQAQLREIAQDHRRALDEALQSMEQAYVEEIVRQRKVIAELREKQDGQTA